MSDGIGAVQTINTVEKITDLPDNNGIYAVSKVGPFTTKEGAALFLKKNRN